MEVYERIHEMETSGVKVIMREDLVDPIWFPVRRVLFAPTHLTVEAWDHMLCEVLWQAS